MAYMTNIVPVKYWESIYDKIFCRHIELDDYEVYWLSEDGVMHKGVYSIRELFNNLPYPKRKHFFDYTDWREERIDEFFNYPAQFFYDYERLFGFEKE